jgi:cytochrome P450
VATPVAFPMFRAEEIAGYVPACAPVLARWNKADRGYSTDMAATTLQALEDTVLGVDLATEDHRRIAAAGTAHCVVRCLCLTPITGLESHPGTSRMVHANRDLSNVAARALAVRRKNGGEGGDLLGRLVTARDPAAGSAFPDSRSIENVVTFLLAGHETTRKRSPGRSILSRSFRIGRKERAKRYGASPEIA